MIASPYFAKRNWHCPLSKLRNVARGHVGYNRSIFPNQAEHHFKNWLFKRTLPRLWFFYRGRHGQCLADGCAMWRWHDHKQTLGYCGLAGNPLIMEVKDD